VNIISNLLGKKPAPVNPSVMERRREQVALEPAVSQKILAIIMASYAIESHQDFYDWLQNSVAEVLPHNMLLACWGAFDGEQKPSLKYDLTSSLNYVSTQALYDAPEKIDGFMSLLHKLWIQNASRWFVINDLDGFTKDHGFKEHCFKTCFPKAFSHLNSTLIYGINDVRGSNNCLYVFFSEAKSFKVQNSIMGLLMPHIDSTIRRIQHLEQAQAASTNEFISVVARLSPRELEIVNWVRLGKTNSEVANLLFISQNTVKTHLKNIFEKLGVTKRAEAIGKLSMEFNSQSA
jgi:transcriptional regulator EpsA